MKTIAMIQIHTITAGSAKCVCGGIAISFSGYHPDGFQMYLTEG